MLVAPDVFEKFINNILKIMSKSYLSAPGLKYDTMLKMTEINLLKILTSIYFLKRVQEEGFFIFPIDTTNPTINI